MLLLVVLVAAFIVGFFLVDKGREVGESIGAVTILISIVGIGIFTGLIIAANSNQEGDYLAKLEQRNVLVYQVENKTYINDNNVGTVELLKQVGDFNAEIITKQIGRKNIWYGLVFEPWASKIDLIEYGG